MDRCNPGAGDAPSRVLQAAEELFAEKGYDAVSLNTIARRAMVSKANVFHHFRSKADLYFEVLRSASAASRVDLDIGAVSPDYGADISAFAQQHLTNYMASPTKARLLIREFLDDTADIGQLLTREDFARNFKLLVTLLQRGQDAGQLDNRFEPDLVATLIIAANVFYFRARTSMRQIGARVFEQSPEAYGTLVVDLILNGIRARPDTG